MVNVPEELKSLYRNDVVPIAFGTAKKDLRLYFPELDLTIETDRIVDDSFDFQENLCSAFDLTLGSCEGAIFKVTVANLIQDLSGYEFIATQIVEDTYTMPLGTYRVDSCRKQNDLWFREIVAYNSMVKANVDVSAWYNSLSWPQTVKSMRESLISHLGLTCEEQTITNDSVQLAKTVNPSSLIAKDVLFRLCEINAGFGHITRDNKFKVIQLSGIGLYPSESLYPSEDLFPSESGEYVTSSYESAEYEEYIVEPITSITIREDYDDAGATAGTQGNPYIIDGNFLLYGKSAVELQVIAEEILLQVKNKFYRPHTTKMIGLPYMEVGDSVTIITDSDAVESFIFKRRLTGIQALRDEISAAGNRKRSQVVGMNTQIQQIKGKALRIQKSVDQLSIDMVDMEEGLQSQITLTAGQLQTQITDNKNELQSQITQTAGQLQTEITDNYNQLNSVITQTAGSLQTQITDNKNDANSQFTQLSNQIAFKVSRGDISTELSLEPGQVRLTSNRLIVDSTNFKLDENGNATFSGDVIGATIQGVNIVGSYEASFTSVSVRGTSSETNIYGGTVECTRLNVSTVNGGSPITTSDPANRLSDSGYNLNWAGNQCLFAWSGQDLGQNAYRWGTVYLSSAPSVSSDRNLKHDIEDLSIVYRQLILKLKPVRFRYNDGDSGRYHLGFISQDVESAMQELEIDAKDFAGFIKSPVYAEQDENGVYDVNSEITGYIYMLRYEEFIAPIISLIQEQADEIRELKEAVNYLKTKIS